MRTRTAWTSLTLAAALVLALAGCGGANQLSSESVPVEVDEHAQFPPGTTMARLHAAGKIRIGTKLDQPLFGLQGLDGKPQGFDVEIARIIAGKLGIPPDKIEWVEAPSKTREEVLEQHKVDMVVATYTINDKRRARVTFAGPYYVAGQDLMVQRDDTTITDVDALRRSGARVCSVQGSTPGEEIKRRVDPANVVLFDVYSKCADALRTGQVEAVTTDNVVLMGLVNKSNGRFKLTERPFTDEPYGIGVHKGDTAFCEFINRSLTEAARSGSYQRAWQATAGKVSDRTATLPPLQACR